MVADTGYGWYIGYWHQGWYASYSGYQIQHMMVHSRPQIAGTSYTVRHIWRGVQMADPGVYRWMVYRWYTG